MRRRAVTLALALALALACAAPVRAQDVDPSRAISVEVKAERERWYVGERVVVRLAVRVLDRTFLDEHVVQPYQRELGLPVRLVAPWLTGRTFSRESSWSKPVLVALNDGDCELGSGPEKGVLRQGFVLHPEQPEELDLSCAVEITVATEFREDFVEGRVAVDPRTVRFPVPGPMIRVLPVPDEGRPEPWSGAVGTDLRLSATAVRKEDGPGRLVELTLEVESAGAGRDLTLPPLDGLPGFHLLGSRRWEQAASDGSWSTSRGYELEILDLAVRAIPSIPFSYFDPVQEQFVTIETGAIPLEPVPAGQVPDDGDGSAEGPEGSGTGNLVGAGVAVLVLLALGVVLARSRSRRAAAATPTARAAEAARRALAEPARDPAEVLAAFLAERLACETAAVITPDLARRLQRAGIAPEAAGRIAALLERLVGARYGGAPPTATDRDAARAVVDELSR